ncbi:hypothetical protein GCM10011487_44710 [Steroidobacter agaridevorans]|uniref:Uncharacterized protein n=1 Tax=Steroidobacter agaridevorans TaxID=2695856 RepID=A0A829YI15_9GAMM|nr:hypothetical protein GCM10011487_44710 [Steroidobacter agaridevorans]
MSRELARGSPGADHFGSTLAEIYTSAALQPIASVNRQFLRLLLQSERISNFSAISEILTSAHDVVPHLIEACPFTLFDLRFRDGTAWRKLAQAMTNDSIPSAEPSAVVGLVNSATVLAWYAARRWPTEAGLLLGATDEVLMALQSVELTQLQTVSARHADWIRPRWTDKISAWLELVSLARNPRAIGDGSLRIRAMEHFLGDLVN